MVVLLFLLRKMLPCYQFLSRTLTQTLISLQWKRKSEPRKQRSNQNHFIHLMLSFFRSLPVNLTWPSVRGFASVALTQARIWPLAHGDSDDRLTRPRIRPFAHGDLRDHESRSFVYSRRQPASTDPGRILLHHHQSSHSTLTMSQPQHNNI